MKKSLWTLLFIFPLLSLSNLCCATTITKESILQGVNIIRESAKIPDLVENKKLDSAAQKKADDMAKRGYFSHVDPEGNQVFGLIDNEGYNYDFAGENLGVGFSQEEDIVSAWVVSTSHYANIVNGDYKETGIGIAHGIYQGKETMFVVQLFADPIPAELPKISAITVVKNDDTVHELNQPLGTITATNSPEIPAMGAVEEQKPNKIIYTAIFLLAVTVGYLIGYALTSFRN